VLAAGVSDSLGIVAVVAVAFVGFVIAWFFRSETWGRVTAISLILGIAAGNAFIYRTDAEDAYITYRYAQNLAAGHGAVFNIGERVEGYSNFLWMILLAAGHKVTGVPINTYARGLALVAALAAVYLTYRLVLSLTNRVGLALLGGLLLACAGPFAAYALGGLETPLFALLLVGVVFCLSRGTLRWAGVLTALAMMTRPDVIALIVPISIWLVFVARPAKFSAARRIAEYLVPFGLVVVPWTIWRVAYYGYIIPNAVAAKLGGAGPIDQVKDGLRYGKGFGVGLAPLVVLGVVALALPLIVKHRVHVDATFWLIFSVVATLAVFVVAAGGDWMPAWRLLAPTTPLIVVLLTYLVHLNADAWQSMIESRTALAVTCVAGVLLFAVSFSDSNMISRVRLWTHQVDALATQGKWLRTELPGATVAVFANGSISYHAGAKVTMLDMLGLTDEHIARHGKRHGANVTVGHRAYDDAYVRAQRPDLVMFNGDGFEPKPSCSVPAGYSPEYVGATFRAHRGNPTGSYVNLLVRADEARTVIARLDRSPLFTAVACP
jgi:hypothetical protein